MRTNSSAFRRYIRVVVLIGITVCFVSKPMLARAGGIDTISPAAARVGEVVTIKGHGFGALNVRVTVGGVAAVVLSANGNQVTFRVPDGVKPGLAQVVATNPGLQTGSIDFRMLDGILLPGDPSAPAVNSLFDKPGKPVDPSLVQDGVILTQLEVLFRPGATVEEINNALELVEGGIDSMSKGIGFVTIDVPQQDMADALLQLADTLSSAPGIGAAFPGREAASDELPPVPQFLNNELLPTGFPAAWNARQLATHGCESRKVPILVGDDFVSILPNSHVGFSTEIPSANFRVIPSGSGDSTHGYDVTTTMAAAFNEHTPTGANPFVQCLDITGVEVHTDLRTAMDTMVANFPPPPFVMNYSQGFNDKCAVELDANGKRRCTVDSIRGVPSAFQRAALGLYWRKKTSQLWDKFFLAASAGNSREPLGTDPDYLVASAYPGAGQALFSSNLTFGAAADSFFSSTSSSSFWHPVGQPDFPDLTATTSEMSLLTQAIQNEGLDKVEPADNTLIVGSTQPGTDPATLVPSIFSNLGPDLFAVGENVITFAGSEDGTSFAAPQVAGLASYLWLLSDDLRSKPASTTRDAIFQNSRPDSNGFVIDAYATILSLDAASLPTPSSAPVRLAILDVNNDSKFDENDIQIFLNNFLDANGNAVEPTARDYSRYDLNGDGFTGGSHTDHFDLDRVNSTQYGSTTFSTDVQQQIEGNTIHFNATAVNDLEILCYYAYSAMFTGDTTARAHLLANCAGVTVKVSPKTATLTAGGTQQFGATVHGTNDPRVSWSVDGIRGGNSSVGTISTSGLFTAAGSGSHTIRATSVVDSTAHDDASVTITSSCSPGNFNYQHYFLANPTQVIDSDYFTSGATHSDQLPEASINVGYGSITANASGSNFFPYNPASGNGTHDGGSISGGQFQDELILVPTDPTLNGTPANVTISFQVNATSHVSGDRAGTYWNANIGFPWQFTKNGHLSTVAGQTYGDPNGGTYSITAPASFYTSLGTPITLNASLFASVGFECLFTETCPDSASQGLTGAASINASFAWKGMTVLDQSGKPVSFTVCSASGKNWATP